MNLDCCHRPVFGTGQIQAIQTRSIRKNLYRTLSISCYQDWPVFPWDAPYDQAFCDNDALIVGSGENLNYISRGCVIDCFLDALTWSQGDDRRLGERRKHKCRQTPEKYANQRPFFHHGFLHLLVDIISTGNLC